MNNNDDLLSSHQAAAIAGCHHSTIRRAAISGKLHARKLGRDWFVRRADLDAWIASGGYHPDRIRLDRRKRG